MMHPADRPRKLVVICGPTGIGKTGDAIELARELNGEIVGADSMQIYKLMDIGTAKPTSEEQTAAKHHLIDIVYPDAHFDAAMYVEAADEVIGNIYQRNRTPLVVGGTGFYIRALLYGLYPSPPSNPEVRRRLKREALDSGPQILHDELRKVDPEAAARIHPNDTYRIVRALETYESTGKPISRHQREHGFSEKRYDPLIVGLNTERPILYDRINQRVDIMIQNGLLHETESLLDRGYTPELKSMQSLGYRHMCMYIAENSTWEEAVEIMKRDTRRYAKRQLTWFSKIPGIIWTEPGRADQIKNSIQRFIFA